MDKRKLTRRVILGSLAGGLGGAALILHTLKGRYRVAMPDRRKEYTAEWSKYVKALDLSVEDIDGPSTFTLDCKPTVGTKFQVLSITAMYHRSGYPLKYPEAPGMYLIYDGEVEVVPPIVEKRPALSITATGLVKTPDSRESIPPGKCIFVPRNGGEEGFFEVDNGAPRKLSASKINSACAEIGGVIKFDYPKDTVLTKGAHWVIPATSGLGLELACEVVGFAKIIGRNTAKIAAERYLNNQDVQQFVVSNTERAKTLQENRDNDLQLDQHMKEELDQVISEKSTRTYQFAAYVDLQTGITLREEISTEVRRPQVDEVDRDVIITQVRES